MMRATWLRFGIVTTLVALAVVSALLSRRANEVSRERKALVRLKQDEVEVRTYGEPDENEPVQEFFANEGVTEIEFVQGYEEDERLEPERLKALADLKRLERLSINGFDLDWYHVDDLPTLPTVREFDWRPREPARYDGDKLAEICGKLPNLRSLGLIDVQISDEDLASIPPLKELDELYLDTEGVTGEFLGSLSDGRLECLRIFGADLTLEGFRRLAEVKTLRRVEFGTVHLPHEALEALPSLEHIEDLEFLLAPGPIPEETLDSFNRNGNERFERGGKEFFQRLWPESSTQLGGDGWFYDRGEAMK